MSTKPGINTEARKGNRNRDPGAMDRERAGYEKSDGEMGKTGLCLIGSREVNMGKGRGRQNGSQDVQTSHKE